MKIYKNWVIFAYLILLLYFCSFYESSMFTSFLVFPLFFLIPSLVGYALSSLLIKKKGRDNLLLFFSIGSIFILSYCFILNLFNIFNLFFVLPIIIISLFYYLFTNHKKSFEIRILRKETIIPLGIGLSLTIIFRSFSRYPLQYGWDIFMHLFIIKQISSNLFYVLANSFSSNFLLSAYTSIFHLLTSLVTKITGIDPINLFWVAPFYLVPIFSYGLFYLSSSLIPKRNLATLVCFLGTFIVEYIGESNHLYFIPATIVIILIPFVIATAWKSFIVQKDFSVKNILFHSLILISLFMYHFFIGGVFAVLLVLTVILKRIKSKSYRAYTLIIATLIIFSFLFFIIPKNFDIISLPESGLKNYLTTEKIGFLEDWYSPSLLFFLGLGLLYSLLKKRDYLDILIIFTILSLLIFMLPFSFTYRVQVIFHSSFAFFIGLGIFCLLERVKEFKSLIISLLILIFIVFSVLQIVDYCRTRISWSDKLDYLTAFSEEEKDMAMWINKNTSEDKLIMANRREQMLYMGLSSRDGVDYYRNENLITSVFLKNDSQEAYTLLNNLADCKKILILYSGRTEYGFGKENGKVFVPQIFSEESNFRKFLNKEYFNLLNNISGDVYLFSINCDKNETKT